MELEGHAVDTMVVLSDEVEDGQSQALIDDTRGLRRRPSRDVAVKMW